MSYPPLAELSLDVVEGVVKVGLALFAVWLFWVGASIGSFLNVVVYRLPLGKNLVTPGSCCPVCNHAIRARHNIPILGWLSLGGRCFDCQTPISSRYPLVEALLGTVFLLVGIEFILGGSNLVDVSREPWGRLPWPILGRAYAMHVVLATTLIGAALIECDGRRIPPSLFVPTIFFSLLWPLLFSQTRPESIWFGERGLFESALEGAAGTLAGAALGLAISVVWRLSSRHHAPPRFAPVGCLASVGAALGWRGLVMIALYGTLLFFVIVLLAGRARGRYLPWPACLTAALLVVLPTYRSGATWFQPPATTSLFVFELAAASVLPPTAVCAWLKPARFWRRAPRSFPLEHAAERPTPQPPLEQPPTESFSSDPPLSESPHDP